MILLPHHVERRRACKRCAAGHDGLAKRKGKEEGGGGGDRDGGEVHTGAGCLLHETDESGHEQKARQSLRLQKSYGASWPEAYLLPWDEYIQHKSRPLICATGSPLLTTIDNGFGRGPSLWLLVYGCPNCAHNGRSERHPDHHNARDRQSDLSGVSRELASN